MSPAGSRIRPRISPWFARQSPHPNTVGWSIRQERHPGSNDNHSSCFSVSDGYHYGQPWMSQSTLTGTIFNSNSVAKTRTIVADRNLSSKNIVFVMYHKLNSRNSWKFIVTLWNSRAWTPPHGCASVPSHLIITLHFVIPVALCNNACRSL